MGNNQKIKNYDKITLITPEIKTNNEKKTQKNSKILLLKEKLFEKNIFERKKEAEEKYENYKKKKEADEKYEKNINNKENESIENEYYSIYEMNLYDNTNKNIMKIYLDFLKKNDDFIKNNIKTEETFINEFNKYKVLFTPEEIKSFYGEDKKTEKENFINLLNKISNSDDLIKLKSEIKKEYNHQFYFNQPISFDNKELYYFKNIQLLIDLILKLKANSFQTRKKIIKLIIDSNYLKNDEITNNEKKMEYLIIILLKDENYYQNYNLERLKSNYTEEEIEEFLKKNPSFKYDKDTNSIIKSEMPYSLKKYCLNLLNSYTFISNTLKFDAFLTENIFVDYIKKIKEFIIKISGSNVFKEILKEIYKKDCNFISQEEINYYINNKIHFYPLIDTNSLGLTDKLSLNTYIFSEIKAIRTNCSIDHGNLLHIALVIVSSFHEINHSIRIILFFKKNGNFEIRTPNLNISGNEINEGGNQLEFLLFGKVIDSLNIIESLFILNENNYKQSLKEFRNNFKRIKEEVLEGKKDCFEIKGIFEKLNIDDKEMINQIIKDVKSEFPTKIIAKYHNSPTIIEAGIRSDDRLGLSCEFDSP